MKSAKAPLCCGKEARYVVQSISMAYWFCGECRNEVTEAKSEPAGTEIGVKYTGFLNPVNPSPAGSAITVPGASTYRYHSGGLIHAFIPSAPGAPCHQTSPSEVTHCFYHLAPGQFCTCNQMHLDNSLRLAPSPFNQGLASPPVQPTTNGTTPLATPAPVVVNFTGHESLAHFTQALKEACEELGKAQFDLSNNKIHVSNPDLAPKINTVTGVNKIFKDACGNIWKEEDLAAPAPVHPLKALYKEVYGSDDMKDALYHSMMYDQGAIKVHSDSDAFSGAKLGMSLGKRGEDRFVQATKLLMDEGMARAVLALNSEDDEDADDEDWKGPVDCPCGCNPANDDSES